MWATKVQVKPCKIPHVNEPTPTWSHPHSWLHTHPLSTHPVVQDRRHVSIFSALWKHTYSNILKISPPKTESFQIKIDDIFHISAQNIDLGYLLELPQQGSSNEYPQSMFLSRNKKNNVYICKPQFYYIKVGFKGVKILYVCFCDVSVPSFAFSLNLYFSLSSHILALLSLFLTYSGR